MAKRPLVKLDSLKAEKPAINTAKKPAATVSPTPDEVLSGPKRAGDDRRGQTIRLSPDAWAQLKILAVQEKKTSHDLLIEGVNDVFRKRNLSPIA